MNKYTYYGRTLDEIKAAAEAATPGPWIAAGPSFGKEHAAYFDSVLIDRDGDEDDGYAIADCPLGLDGHEQVSADMDYIAAVNPVTILAMAARIEELERGRDAVRFEGFRLAQEMAVNICDSHSIERWALYKGRSPYTGSEEGRACNIVQGESIGAEFCADAIRAMKLLAEWSEPVGNSEQLPDANSADWPHPDGFAGELTEQQK